LLYRSIYSANRDILSDPNLLELGQVVTIPYLE
jgi:nucleoid-associated protein YgaU